MALIGVWCRLATTIAPEARLTVSEVNRARILAWAANPGQGCKLFGSPNGLRSGMDSIGHFAPLFIVGLICAVLGWGVVYLSSRIERERAARHIEKYGDQPHEN